ncbi:XRE family transcriptional regulator [Macrococcoides canis]|uniref:helix-turn-helix domain-containing protein n=1 Tax=Macrococcoides canis TaxID=1855823 RepID=UPI001060A511|nr:helix-turn-helix transcriptional regulator [Macrococcus canis]TDM21193.1 XRE family transcriptional regulator [Macrococcus canis]TDM23966.1 XRE family transcriptional regulator [Macrococcus canis]
MKLNDKEKEIISKKIRQVRGNYTMEEFSRIIGVSIGAINNYEKGRITPKDKVLIKIIEQSNNPNASIEEFIYGDPNDYILNLFKDIDYLKINNFDSKGNPIIESHQFVLTQIPEFIKRGYINYGDIESILKKSLEICNELKHDITFIDLWNSYNLGKLKYDIEDNEDFRKNILPILDKNLKYISNLERYSKLIDLFTETFTNDDSRTMYPTSIIRKYEPKLEDIFNAEYLSSLSEPEKARLQMDFKNNSSNLFGFWEEFDELYKYNLEQYIYDYKRENEMIIKDLKEKNLDFNDKNVIKKYKKEWWKQD